MSDTADTSQSWSAPSGASGSPSSLNVFHRVVSFVADDASEAALRTGLASLGRELEMRRGGLPQAMKFLEKDISFRAVIVDLSGLEDPEPALESFAQVCPPDVMVLAIGDNGDIGFYRNLVQNLGVTEYLHKPLTRDAVQRLMLPHLAGDAAVATDMVRGGHVVAVCGASGGAGATSIAVNFALELSDATKGKVALLDLNLQGGAASAMLAARPGMGLRTALEDADRADALLLERTATEIDDRMRLIAAEELLAGGLNVTEDGVRRVIELLRQKFNFIVIDIPRPIQPAMYPALVAARQVVVVLEPSVTSVRNAKSIRALVGSLTGADRVMTVLNRANIKGGLPPEMVRTGLGAAPDVMVPDLGKAMLEALNFGIPAVRRIPALRRSLAPLVAEVARIRSVRARSWFRRLFPS